MNKMKQIIKEEKTQTVNDVQLKDLYDAACKTEQQIINLSIASMSFSNPMIKKAVVALKSQASSLTQLIGGAMNDTDDINFGAAEEKQDLEANPDSEQMIEGVIKGLKTIVEKFDFQRDVLDKNKKKDSKDKDSKDKDSEDENSEDETLDESDMSINNDVPLMEIDMSESYEYMKEGCLSVSNLQAFKDKTVAKLIEAKKNKKVSNTFNNITNSIKEAKDIKNLNECINNLYDYADKNNIVIKF